MDETTANAIVTLVAVALGAGLGALFQWLTALWQMKQTRVSDLRDLRRDVYFQAIDDLEAFRYATDVLLQRLSDYAAHAAEQDSRNAEAERLDGLAVEAVDAVFASQRAVEKIRDRVVAVGSDAVVDALDKSISAFRKYTDEIDSDAGTFQASVAQAMQVQHFSARKELNAAVRHDLGVDSIKT